MVSAFGFGFDFVVLRCLGWIRCSWVVVLGVGLCLGIWLFTALVGLVFILPIVCLGG